MLGGDTLFIQGIDAVDFVFFAAYFKGGATVEAVHRAMAFLKELRLTF